MSLEDALKGAQSAAPNIEQKSKNVPNIGQKLDYAPNTGQKLDYAPNTGQKLDYAPNIGQKSNQMLQIDPETGEVVTTDLSVKEFNVDTSVFDFDALEEAEVGVNLQPLYWSPSAPGQKSRGFFMGFSTILKNEPGGQVEIDVAVWLTRTELLMNGGASFVKLFKNIQPGTPIQIEYCGKEKTKTGHNVNLFKLNMLNLPR